MASIAVVSQSVSELETRSGRCTPKKAAWEEKSRNDRPTLSTKGSATSPPLVTMSAGSAIGTGASGRSRRSATAA